MIFGGMMAFVILGCAFAYLHTQSNNKTWKSIWLALCFVMATAAIMGSNIQANMAGDTATSGITFTLFNIMFWILMILMLVFAFNLVRGFLMIMWEAAHGKKT